MSVGRICMRDVETVTPEENTLAAAQRMRDQNVGTLVVVDTDRRPVGMLSDRDVTTRVVAAGAEPGTTPVSDVMSRAPATVHAETSVESTLATMRKHGCRRIPVVHEDGSLYGVVSLDDVLELLAEEFRDIGRLMDEERPPFHTRTMPPDDDTSRND